MITAMRVTMTMWNSKPKVLRSSGWGPANTSLSTLQKLGGHCVLSWLRPSIMYLCLKQPRGEEPGQQLLPQTRTAARVRGRDRYKAANPVAPPACSGKLQRQRRLFFTSSVQMSFPGGSVVKKPRADAGDQGSIPRLGRPPGEGNGKPLQYSCLENPMDREVWRITVHGVSKQGSQESNTTYRLNNN